MQAMRNPGLQRSTPWTDAALTFVLAAVIPPLFHLLPSWNGVHPGVRFNPLFFAPLVAVYYTTGALPLVIASSAPLVNYVLFGRPRASTAAALTIELLAFIAVLILLQRKHFRSRFLAPGAYALAKLASLGALAALYAAGAEGAPDLTQFFERSFVVAWPGIAVLILLGRPAAPRTGRTRYGNLG